MSVFPTGLPTLFLRSERNLNIFGLRPAYDNCRKQVVSQICQERGNIGGRTREAQRSHNGNKAQGCKTFFKKY